MAIRVSLGRRSYEVVVLDSYRELPKRMLALGIPKTGWVVSHRRILAHYGRILLGPLLRAGWDLNPISVPEAETSKSLRMAESLLSRITRSSNMQVPVLLAFGGGVVGDLTGFVAAVFRRGVPYVQIPTTLLSQADSAIGGKAGVDLAKAKNLVGAFYQPKLVFSNVSLLKTLPLRQRESGFAEVVKSAVVADPYLFGFLEKRLDDCLALRGRAVRVMVERCSRIKARIVSRDERDTMGLRARLNFGHTLGHALEAATRYRRLTHGEAIAIGMCAATELAIELDMCDLKVLDRLVNMLKRAGLPERARGIGLSSVLKAMRYDKKFIHGRPRWILPRRIGEVVVAEDIPPKVARRVLAKYVS